MLSSPSEQFRGQATPFGDTSYFIAPTDPRDQWRSRAVKVAERDRGRLKVTELVMSESITTVGAHCGAKPARQLYEFFLDSTEILYSTPDVFDEAMDDHTRFDGALSVSDGVTVVGMARSKDLYVVSFGSDFDKVRGIHRTS
ncbi:MAG: hypothetical protein KGI89_02520 [Euryarchaeota archaeon]|nr:hypothetical protein [Euryarchaeota archaeon]